MKILVLILFVIAWSGKALELDNITATIAVVEYKPITNSSLTGIERVLANTEEFITLIESVNKTNLDLIIFPEGTLQIIEPDLTAEVTVLDTPCDSPNYPDFLRKLSCVARSKSTYLVINIVEKDEKVKCENESQSENCLIFGFLFYNTDIIFDRSGRIVAKYRKYNLFNEQYLDRPTKPEVIVFETDFGAKFGIFTCFDILFKSPAEDILMQKPDAVIYPTMWHSELPFFTSLQTQQMWAQAHNLKLFAAGANYPVYASGGSGVYSGVDGAVIFDIIAKGGTEILLYKYIPSGSDSNPQPPMPYQDIDYLGKEMDAFPLQRDDSLTNFSSIVLDTKTQESFSGRLCHTNTSSCCDYDIKITNNATNTTKKNTYTYHLVIFSGIRHYPKVVDAGMETCALLACLNSSLTSCGMRFSKYEDINWPITFENITLKANFDVGENKTLFPNSLLSSIRPINASETIWAQNGSETLFSVEKPQNRLLTFAILGRDFSQDFIIV